MITGKKKPNYNQFEQEIEELIGVVEEIRGIEYYMYVLSQTFKQSEECLRNHRQEYLESLNGEDKEVLRSIIFNDPDHSIKANPLFQALWSSYFITVHSELEETWQLITEKFKLFFGITSRFGVLNYNYFNDKAVGSFNDLDTLVSKHTILFDYNYIRNKLIHKKIDPSSPEFLRVQSKVNSGEIPYLKIIQIDSHVEFQITDINFVEMYAKKVLAFLKGILPS